MNGMRIVVLIAALGGLMSAAVDPDELLKALRRLSYRSALTATLATRLVPVLARDAGRMGDAARCRPHPPSRLVVVRAALAGALDRAVEVAAALEVRGYALAGRPGRRRRPVSRHDLRVGAAALAVAAIALAGLAAGVGRAEPYPTLDLALGPGELGLAGALVLLGAAPLLGRSARLGVARA
jgi:energy-coupling factor transport system permease protein